MLKYHSPVVRSKYPWELLLCAVQRQRLATNLVTPLRDGWREGGCSVTAAVLPGGSAVSLVLLASWLWFQARTVPEMKVLKRR